MRYTEEQLTSELLDQPRFTGDPIKIFICSTPRSGSYMLCRYMINAGLGVPHEYFNPNIIRQIAPRLALPRVCENLKWQTPSRWDRIPWPRPLKIAEVKFLDEYVSALIPRRCRNGIFAAKIHYDQYIRVLDNSIGRKLLNGGLFVYLFRENLLSQAISRNFAYLTGRWGDDDAVSTAPSVQLDLLGPRGIDRELETLADEDRGWRVFLGKNGLSPITTSYEELCKNPQALVAEIAKRLGLDASTFSNDYHEPAASSAVDVPGLPSKAEVARGYLAAMRQLQGYPDKPKPSPQVLSLQPRQETVE